MGEFGDLLQICQSFTHQLLVASKIAIEAGLKFAKVYLAKCNLACDSPNFPLLKFPSIQYTVKDIPTNLKFRVSIPEDI